MTIADQLERVLDRGTYAATVSALSALAEVKAAAEHIRRSIGQKCRWDIERIGRAK